MTTAPFKMPTRKTQLAGIILACSCFTSTAFGQILVKAETLSDLTITVERSVPGQVVAIQQADIASQLTAVVTELPVLVGQTLTEGEEVGRLDCVDYELMLQQAKAELNALDANRALVKKQLSRLEKLRASRNASEEQINQKQSEMSVVTSRIAAQSIGIKTAQRQIEKCAILSPFAGIITAVHSETGSYVNPGTPLFSITNPKRVELDVMLTQEQLAQVTAYQTLYFLSEQQVYPVEIRTALPLIDSVSQTRKVRLAFPGNTPFPGSKGRLQWELTGNMLPSSLVVDRDQSRGIFIVDSQDSGKTVAKFVELEDITPGQPASVDISEDTLVVTDGRFRLSNGVEITLE